MHRLRFTSLGLASAAVCGILVAGAARAAECEQRSAGEPAPPCRAAPPSSGGADFAVLIVLHLTAAELNCPFRIEEGRVRRLLAHYSLRLSDIYTRPRSKELSAEADKVVESFRTDSQKACETAWKHFGPAATFEGYLQPR